MQYLGFPNQNDFIYADLLVTPMLPMKFQDNWPLFHEKKQKMDFQEGGHGGHLGFTTGIILAFFFLSSSHLNASYQVSSQFAFLFRRRSKK